MNLRIICLVSASLCLCATITHAETIRVPEDYSTIQAAIDAATDGDEIIVAPGTYREAIDFLGKALHLIGSGGQDVTTIDVTGMETTAVTCANGEGSETILEGFKITGGDFVRGGGMYILSSSPTITDCFFLSNSGRWGGGIYCEGGSPTLVDVEFRNNFAIYGASMHNSGEGVPTLTRCVFVGNFAQYWAGGVLNQFESNAVLTDCTFDSNVAETESGGAIFNFRVSPTITNCTFTANSSFDGGAIHNRGDVNATIIKCTFRDNYAESMGGAIDTHWSIGVVHGCLFENNVAGSRGGAVNSHDNRTILTSCIFRRNIASLGGGMYVTRQIFATTVTNCAFLGNVARRGGGVYCDWSALGTIIRNCTLAGNVSRDSGGGVFTERANVIFLYNSIFWNNYPDELHADDNNLIATTYSNIQGGYEGEGNIEADPRFIRTPNPGPDGEWGTDDDDPGDPRLRVTSPCIDAADNLALPEELELDLDGLPRYVDSPDSDDTGRCEVPCERAIIDMGAYEYQLHDPDPPTQLQASDDEYPARVALTWNASLYGVDYRLYRHVENDPDASEPITDWFAETEFDDTTAEPGIVHWYWLKSRSTMGESPFSEGETGSRWLGPPPPPTDLTATDGEYTERVVLTWSPSHTADAYRLYRHTENDPDAAAPITDWQVETAFDDETGDPGVEYWYWTTARNKNGESDWSEGDTGFRWAGPPPPPTDVRATDGTQRTAVTVEWEPARFTDDYRVYRHTANDAESSEPLSDWLTGTRFIDLSAVPGQIYWYWVTARNTNGESDWSEGDSGYRSCVSDPEWLCDGDVSGDGQVNPVDLGFVQANFGNTDPQALCNYDLDCDRQINPVDAGIVQSLFGTCEEPRDVCP